MFLLVFNQLNWDILLVQCFVSEDRRELRVIRGSQSEVRSPCRGPGGVSASLEEDEILKMCPAWLNKEKEESSKLARVGGSMPLLKMSRCKL